MYDSRFFFLVLFLTFYSLSNSEIPSFVDAHQDKDTIYNNRTGYWLQCKVRGRPQPVIQWYKNGNPLDTSGKLYRLQTVVTPIDTFSSLVTSQIYLQGKYLLDCYCADIYI